MCIETSIILSIFFDMSPLDNKISGRLALITGASGGIGAAVARDLWVEGCSLALTGFSKFQAVEDLEQELLSNGTHEGQKISTYQLDTGDVAAIEKLFQDIEKNHGQGGPDILISNAGYGKRLPGILDVSIEEFDHTININLRASFILSKLSIPHMEAQGWGRIVFISSIAAIGGGINACHYAASKAGLSGMMRNLAAKHAKSGITVNDVAPAMIGETGMIPDAKFVEGTPGDVKNIPVGRLGTPEECAGVVTMMCKTGYMTGQSVLLSGGLK
ncbi:3-oxoacyl-reductase [Xylariaceae sp. FL1651]|nr:3-oxoacyl-reductase [Xylariaceae sp. FL1651]